MSRKYEFAEYVSISAGLALSASSYAMVAGLFRFTDGIYAIAAVALAGVLCILLSSPIAELASRFPAAPGISTYLKVAFGERISLPVVLLYLGLIAVFAGVESFVFSEVMSLLFPSVSRYLLIVGLLGGIVVINLFGLEVPRKLQFVITVILLLGMLIISLWALSGTRESLAPVEADSVPVGSGWVNAIALSLFLYVGFEWVTPLGRSASSYERLVPLSMPVAVALLGLVYGCFVAALDVRLPRAVIINTPIPQFELSVLVGQAAGAYFAAGLSLLAMLSSFNAGLMSAARLVYGLAREGSLPRWCATISLRSGAPMGAIALLGSIALLSGLLVLHFRVYLVAATLGASIQCLIYAGLLLAALRLRRMQPDGKHRYRSRVPRFVQWLLIVTMVALGISALLSAPGHVLLAPGLFVTLSILAVLGAAWSRHARARRASRKQ